MILNTIFQIIEAIGSLATFGAFIFLFIKDKNKQEQINKLTSIAAVLESQNETMKEQNNLITLSFHTDKSKCLQK